VWVAWATGRPLQRADFKMNFPQSRAFMAAVFAIFAVIVLLIVVYFWMQSHVNRVPPSVVLRPLLQVEHLY
jgi:hypothetical protein